MVDVVLLGEVFWAWLWVRNRSAERALLYVGAIFTSVFVATHVSPWFARRFMETGNTFMWLTDRMQEATRPVGAVGAVIPPVPAAAGVHGDAHWIALHVLQGMFTVLMTWAIFMLFMVIEHLVEAFWDGRPSVIWGDRVLANLSGLLCGVVLAWTSVWFMANLSWLSLSASVVQALNHSIFFVLSSELLSFLPSLHAMLSWA
ncbi:hypothetical protein [Alicyclobacillus fastidiosus]|uniref:Uncharacterized protein n=1 Tax=Alicyclobacillus fastidiosus TaxID=392011 RepID=A0ABV5AF89_9BACL|nr:hypothetical protein [Alicyclobacillus fastidiosus]WEH09715.1 hypothetical protein PYS47_24265 [Alicyclobacillus fastidiosus]